LEIKSRKDLAKQTADALRAAVRGGLLPGGGVALLACRPALQQQLDRSDDTDERAAYRILIRAMEEPIRCILTNAGHDASEVLASIRLAGDGHGFDVRSEKIVDMAEAGIWDAVAVLQAAAYGAVASAALALTTDVLVQHKKPQQSMQP
jgi:chaperonin GroEL